MRERELTPWQPDAGAATELSLNRNGHAGWDQFETNERLYGVKTDYDENMYTTSIDRNNPSYRQRAAAADRKAREIEGSAYSNVHRAGLENEVDEEERSVFHTCYRASVLTAQLDSAASNVTFIP